MPVKNGAEYINRIDNGRTQVWIKGSKVEGKISEQLAFKGLMTTQAGLYDLQSREQGKTAFSYTSPQTGDQVGLSFKQPTSKKDLASRRKMMQAWAEAHHGFLGRSPDYMNTALMAFSAAAGILEEHSPRFAANLRHYYAYCRERDITLSHVFMQPKAARYQTFLKTLEEPAAARIVDQNNEGIVVSGAFLLDTQGVTSDEIFVLPAPFPSLETENSEFAFAFAVPSDLDGIHFICRESFVGGESPYNYPLSSRFEEMDTLVIFDEVKVPWDRVFVCGNEDLVYRLINDSHFHTHTSAQLMCKNIAKTEFILGTVEALTEAAGMDGEDLVIEKIAEILVILETLKGLQISAEQNAKRDRWGSMLPDPKPMLAANAYYPKAYPRLIEILQLIGGSSLILIPDEAEFGSPLAPLLNHYMKGIGISGSEQVHLARLAWELGVSAFGGRQQVYERFFFGDAKTVNARLYNTYPRAESKKRVKGFLGS